VDLCARATRPLAAGTKLEMGHGQAFSGIAAELQPAQPMADDRPIPFYMAVDCTLQVDVAAGGLLTYDMVQPIAAGGAAGPDTSSPLWQLRRLQDARFLAESKT
jgi:predicted homoserine dehydrogenase-like protein